jgi:uncharacterized membrane protein
MISLTHLHPMVVHFPIALIIVGFLMDVVSFYFKEKSYLSEFSFYLLLLGTIAAIISLLIGVVSTPEMSGSAGEIKELHELFAWITVSLLVLTIAIRIILKTNNKERSRLRWIVVMLYCFSAVSVSITGFYGGTLVYNYMMPI